MSMDEYYAYIYLDLTKPGHYEYGKGLVFKHEPFYVGKGKGERDMAIAAHKNSPHLYNRIKKINRQFDIVRVIDNVSEDMSFATEIKLIALIGRRSTKRGPLVNLTDGGEGCSGNIHTEEHNKKISLAGMLRDPPSLETREKIRQSKLGKKRLDMVGDNNPMRNPKVVKIISEKYKGHNVTKETREKISKSLKGYKHSEEARAKMSAIAKEKDLINNIRKGRQIKGSQIATSKLDEKKVKRIRDMLSIGKTLQYIADIYGVTDACISRIKNRQTWQHV